MGIVVRRCHDQKWNDDGEETNDMNDQYTNFHDRQLLGHGCVENDSEYYHCNDEECTMPSLRYIASIVQSDEPLNLTENLQSALPPQDWELTPKNFVESKFS